MKRQDIEILSPAGSMDALKAAIKAGADAVYMGGEKFGARAYANNPEEKFLIEAINYVHLHKKKLYLTVNTLLKDNEMKNELYDYLLPYYKAGLDAVIVQDMGVLRFIKENFKDLPIHASTQMSITGSYGASFLKKLGVERIVPARELSMEEIKKIHDDTNMEIECFVHGALCYSYSGRCLLSSLIGGRSGNRGRCAQPCRKCYEAEGKKGNLISMKDLSALEILPDLIEGGVSSFKIEGRMKNPSYVALVTYIYSHYVDLYFKNGKKNYSVKEEDIVKLKDVFNRGGFTKGYYYRDFSSVMITPKKANHTGVEAAKVLSIKGRNMQLVAIRDLNAKDVIEFSGRKDNYTLGKDIKKGEVFSARCLDNIGIKPGKIFNRTRNNSLLSKIDKEIIEKEEKLPISGNLEIKKGNKVSLTITDGDAFACAIGECPSDAKTRPITVDSVKKPILKTGNTPFTFEELDVALDDDLFFPNGALNELRRLALSNLEREIINSYKRPPCEKIFNRSKIDKRNEPSFVSVVVSEKNQFEECLNKDFVKRIFVEFTLAKVGEKLFDKAKKEGKEVFITLPHIMRRELSLREKKLLELFDGALVRNYEELGILVSEKYSKEIVLDSDIYIFNQMAKEMFSDYKNISLTSPMELSFDELKKLSITDMDLNVYGNFPVMLSDQSVNQNFTSKKDSLIKIEDEYGYVFPEITFFNEGYSAIYNNVPLKLFDLNSEISQLNPKSLRLSFTMETKKETKMILDAFEKVYLNNEKDITHFKFTRGHFKRGVK